MKRLTEMQTSVIIGIVTTIIWWIYARWWETMGKQEFIRTIIVIWITVFATGFSYRLTNYLRKKDFLQWYNKLKKKLLNAIGDIQMEILNISILLEKYDIYFKRIPLIKDITEYIIKYLNKAPKKPDDLRIIKEQLVRVIGFLKGIISEFNTDIGEINQSEKILNTLVNIHKQIRRIDIESSYWKKF